MNQADNRKEDRKMEGNCAVTKHNTQPVRVPAVTKSTEYSRADRLGLPLLGSLT